jgi:hypothetical protein
MIKATMKYNVGEEPVRSGDLLVDVQSGENRTLVMRIMTGGSTCMPEGDIVFHQEDVPALLAALRRCATPMDLGREPDGIVG